VPHPLFAKARRRLPRVVLGSLLVCASFSANAHAAGPVTVTDDEGREVSLPAPAQRIVSLAPHVTEVLFAAGAGHRIVGAVAYSDYPDAARDIPRVGGYMSIDLEAIAGLRPDLVIAWSSGSRDAHLDKFAALGIPVFMSESRRLDDVAKSLERFGKLADTESVANAAASEFRERHRRLAERFSSQQPVTIFYQIWNDPLMTINGEHMISDVITLCGGINVFADLPQLAPQVGMEAVIKAAPEVIVASGVDQARPEWLDRWRDWRSLPAVQSDNLHFVHPDLIQRQTPRILDGAEMVCEALEQARTKRIGGRNRDGVRNAG
jgi:iron complex transport system substrate-binding protein